MPFRKAISLVVAIAFLANDLAFAIPEKIYQDNSTLAAPSRLAEETFREKFLIGQFLLSDPQVNLYIKEQILREQEILKNKWEDERTLDLDVSSYIGEKITSGKERIRNNVAGLSKVKLVKITGLLARTGQFAHVGLTGRDYGGTPVMYVDSSFCNWDNDALRKHEIEEILQWEDLRVNILKISDKSQMRAWMTENVDVLLAAARTKLAGTVFETCNSVRDIASLIHSRSHSIEKLYAEKKKQIGESGLRAAFDFEKISALFSYHSDDPDEEKKLNIAASGQSEQLSVITPMFAGPAVVEDVEPARNRKADAVVDLSLNAVLWRMLGNGHKYTFEKVVEQCGKAFKFNEVVAALNAPGNTNLWDNVIGWTGLSGRDAAQEAGRKIADVSDNFSDKEAIVFAKAGIKAVKPSGQICKAIGYWKNGGVHISARDPETGKLVTAHFSASMERLRKNGEESIEVIIEYRRDTNHGPMIFLYDAGEYYHPDSDIPRENPVPLSFYAYPSGKEGLEEMEHINPAVLDIFKTIQGKDIECTERGGRFTKVKIVDHGPREAACQIYCPKPFRGLYKKKTLSVPRSLNGRDLIGQLAHIGVERDAIYGQVINVYLSGDMESADRQPIATFRFNKKKGELEPVILALLDIVEYRKSGPAHPAVAPKIWRSHSVTIRPFDPKNPDGKYIAKVNVKRLLGKALTLYLNREDLLRPDGTLITAGEVGIKEDPDYGPYIALVDPEGKEISRLMKVEGLSEMQTAPFARSALVDYILGAPNIHGGPVIPREYWHDFRILGHGIISLGNKLRFCKINRLGMLVDKDGNNGKKPVFVPVKDRRFGWRINIYDSELYRADRSIAPAAVMVRDLYFKRLIPIETYGFFRAQELAERGMPNTALKRLNMIIAEHPENKEAKALKTRMSKTPAGDGDKALAVDEETRRIVSLADALGSDDQAAIKREAAYFTERWRAEDRLDLIGKLTALTDHSDITESGSLLAAAAFRAMSSLPIELKSLGLLRRLSKVVLYNSPENEGAPVCAEALAFFRTIPDSLIYETSETAALEGAAEKFKYRYSDKSDTFGIYLDQATRAPLLTPIGEAVLISRARLGDDRAKKSAILSNMRLVVPILKKYDWSNLPKEDLFTTGAMGAKKLSDRKSKDDSGDTPNGWLRTGLIRAVELFEPWQGLKFSTYAYPWIQQAIRVYIRDKASTIRVPRHVQEKAALFIRLCKNPSPGKKAINPYDYNISDKIMAKTIGWSAEDVGAIREVIATTTISLHTPYKNADSTLNPESTIEGSAAVGRVDPGFDRYEDEDFLEFVRERAHKVIARNWPDDMIRNTLIFERCVLPKFTLTKPETFESVAADPKVKLTRARVGQIADEIQKLLGQDKVLADETREHLRRDREYGQAQNGGSRPGAVRLAAVKSGVEDGAGEGSPDADEDDGADPDCKDVDRIAERSRDLGDNRDSGTAREALGLGERVVGPADAGELSSVPPKLAEPLLGKVIDNFDLIHGCTGDAEYMPLAALYLARLDGENQANILASLETKASDALKEQVERRKLESMVEIKNMPVAGNIFWAAYEGDLVIGIGKKGTGHGYFVLGQSEKPSCAALDFYDNEGQLKIGYDLPFGTEYAISRGNLEEAEANTENILIDSEFISRGEHLSVLVYEKDGRRWCIIQDLDSENGINVSCKAFPDTVLEGGRREKLVLAMKDGMLGYINKVADIHAFIPEDMTLIKYFKQTADTIEYFYAITAEFPELKLERKRIVELYFFSNLVGNNAYRRRKSLVALSKLLMHGRYNIRGPLLELLEEKLSEFAKAPRATAALYALLNNPEVISGAPPRRIENIRASLRKIIDRNPGKFNTGLLPRTGLGGTMIIKTQNLGAVPVVMPKSRVIKIKRKSPPRPDHGFGGASEEEANREAERLGLPFSDKPVYNHDLTYEAWVQEGFEKYKKITGKTPVVKGGNEEIYFHLGPYEARWPAFWIYAGPEDSPRSKINIYMRCLTLATPYIVLHELLAILDRFPHWLNAVLSTQLLPVFVKRMIYAVFAGRYGMRSDHASGTAEDAWEDYLLRKKAILDGVAKASALLDKTAGAASEEKKALVKKAFVFLGKAHDQYIGGLEAEDDDVLTRGPDLALALIRLLAIAKPGDGRLGLIEYYESRKDIVSKVAAGALFLMRGDRKKAAVKFQDVEMLGPMTTVLMDEADTFAADPEAAYAKVDAVIKAGARMDLDSIIVPEGDLSPAEARRAFMTDIHIIRNVWQRTSNNARIWFIKELAHRISWGFYKLQFVRTDPLLSPEALRKALLADGVGQNIPMAKKAGKDTDKEKALDRIIGWLDQVLDGDLSGLKRGPDTPNIASAREEVRSAASEEDAILARRKFNRLILEDRYPNLCPMHWEEVDFRNLTISDLTHNVFWSPASGSFKSLTGMPRIYKEYFEKVTRRSIPSAEAAASMLRRFGVNPNIAEETMTFKRAMMVFHDRKVVNLWKDKFWGRVPPEFIAAVSRDMLKEINAKRRDELEKINAERKKKGLKEEELVERGLRDIRRVDFETVFIGLGGPVKRSVDGLYEYLEQRLLEDFPTENLGREDVLAVFYGIVDPETEEDDDHSEAREVARDIRGTAAAPSSVIPEKRDKKSLSKPSPIGTPSQLLGEMSAGGVFGKVLARTSLELTDNARRRGKSDSLRTIQGELRILRGLGLVKKVGAKYYLAGWLGDLAGIQWTELSADLGLNKASPENSDLRQTRALIARLKSDGRHIALLADALGSGDSDTAKREASYFEAKWRTPDRAGLIERLAALTSHSDLTERGKLLAAAAFRAMSSLPLEEKSLGLLRRLSKAVLYNSPEDEGAPVCAEALAFFRTIPDNLIYKPKEQELKDDKSPKEDFKYSYPDKTDTFKIYQDQALRKPLLTHTGEAVLIARARLGDDSAKKSVIESNMRLVASLLKKFEWCGLPKEDLFTAGIMGVEVLPNGKPKQGSGAPAREWAHSGLTRAVELFEPWRGRAFSTFAEPHIRSAIGRYIENTKNTIRLPGYIQEKINLFLNLCEHPPADAGSSESDPINPYDESISDETIGGRIGWAREDVGRIREIIFTTVTSIHTPYKIGDNTMDAESTVEGSIGLIDPGFKEYEDADYVEYVRNRAHELITKRWPYDSDRRNLIFDKCLLPVFEGREPEIHEAAGADPRIDVTHARVWQIVKKIESLLVRDKVLSAETRQHLRSESGRKAVDRIAMRKDPGDNLDASAAWEAFAPEEKAIAPAAQSTVPDAPKPAGDSGGSITVPAQDTRESNIVSPDSRNILQNGIRSQIEFEVNAGDKFFKTAKISFRKRVGADSVLRRIESGCAALEVIRGEVLQNSYDSIIDRLRQADFRLGSFVGKIGIEAYYAGTDLIINIVDNGIPVELGEKGRPKERPRDPMVHLGGKGIGINNTKTTLRRLGGTVSWHPLADGTRTEIRIPIDRIGSPSLIGKNEFITAEEHESPVKEKSLLTFAPKKVSPVPSKLSGIRMISLGGHAFIGPEDKIVTPQSQRERVKEAFTPEVVASFRNGTLSTHGNGPQAGMLLEEKYDLIKMTPDEVSRALIDDRIVERTEIDMGEMIKEAWIAQGVPAKDIVIFITEIEVDDTDKTPVKSLGVVNKVKVRSPVPKHIVKIRDIADAVKSGKYVIACGGGGIPVDKNGNVIGGVIDKDLATALLATELRAYGVDIDELVICTDQPYVYNEFGNPETAFRMLTPEQIDELLRNDPEGKRFPKGSIRPKMQAAASFIMGGGRSVRITTLENIRSGDGTLVRAQTQTASEKKSPVSPKLDQAAQLTPDQKRERDLEGGNELLGMLDHSRDGEMAAIEKALIGIIPKLVDMMPLADAQPQEMSVNVKFAGIDTIYRLLANEKPDTRLFLSVLSQETDSSGFYKILLRSLEDVIVDALAPYHKKLEKPKFVSINSRLRWEAYELLTQLHDEAQAKLAADGSVSPGATSTTAAPREVSFNKTDPILITIPDSIKYIFKYYVMLQDKGVTADTPVDLMEGLGDKDRLLAHFRNFETISRFVRQALKERPDEVTRASGESMGKVTTSLYCVENNLIAKITTGRTYVTDRDHIDDMCVLANIYIALTGIGAEEKKAAYLEVYAQETEEAGETGGALKMDAQQNGASPNDTSHDVSNIHIDIKLASDLDEKEQRRVLALAARSGMWPINNLANWFENMEPDAIVAYVDGKPVGMYSFLWRGEDLPFDEALGNGIWVDDSVRKNGVATMLRNELFAYLKSKGYRVFRVTSVKDTITAHRFQLALAKSNGVVIDYGEDGKVKEVTIDLQRYEYIPVPTTATPGEAAPDKTDPNAADGIRPNEFWGPGAPHITQPPDDGSEYGGRTAKKAAIQSRKDAQEITDLAQRIRKSPARNQDQAPVVEPQKGNRIVRKELVPQINLFLKQYRPGEDAYLRPEARILFENIKRGKSDQMSLAQAKDILSWHALHDAQRRAGQLTLDNVTPTEQAILHRIAPTWYVNLGTAGLKKWYQTHKERLSAEVAAVLNPEHRLSDEAVRNTMMSLYVNKGHFKQLGPRSRFSADAIRMAIPRIERLLATLFPELEIRPRPFVKVERISTPGVGVPEASPDRGQAPISKEVSREGADTPMEIAADVPENVASAVEVLERAVTDNFKRGEVYTIRYDARRLAEAGEGEEFSALKALMTYVEGMRMRTGDDKWRDRVKLVKCDSTDGRLISIERYSDISRSNLLGSSQVNVSGSLKGTRVDVVTMMNMVLAACEIPADTPSDKLKDYSVMAKVEHYYNILTGRGFEYSGGISRIILSLPSAAQLSTEELRDYYRLTIEALRKYA